MAYLYSIVHEISDRFLPNKQGPCLGALFCFHANRLPNHNKTDFKEKMDTISIARVTTVSRATNDIPFYFRNPHHPSRHHVYVDCRLFITQPVNRK